MFSPPLFATATQPLEGNQMLKLSFHFVGKCRIHPVYNPREDGRSTDTHCAGCESLYVISLYTRIAERKAREGEGIELRLNTHPEPGLNTAAIPGDDPGEIE
jgi:hypothetical protein